MRPARGCPVVPAKIGTVPSPAAQAVKRAVDDRAAEEAAAIDYVFLAADLVNLQESVLDRILGVRAVAQNPACESEDRRAIVGHCAVPIGHR
jgi:hypothetical protein